MLVNLHTHSNYSDGTLSPKELVARVSNNNIRFFSLSDHDNVFGWKQASECLEESNINYCHGVEITTNVHDNLHVLGYRININDAGLLEKLRHYRLRRVRRIRKIIELLNKMEIEISMKDVGMNEQQTYGRPHVADVLIKKGYARNRKESFGKYLFCGKPAYVPPCGPGIEKAIKAIKEAGGFAVLAHPGVVRDIIDIPSWKEMGLDGIEAYYPYHNNLVVGEFLEMAKKHSLFITAGTDYHGPDTGKENLADFEIPEEILEQMRFLFEK
jgi:predicted metal-dependent phosphoesterase TrpH